MDTTAMKMGRMNRPRDSIDTSEYSGRVAERIAARCKDRGISPERLASALSSRGVKVAKRTAFAYLAGKRTIHPDLYPHLAVVLGFKTVRAMLPNE